MDHSEVVRGMVWEEEGAPPVFPQPSASCSEVGTIAARRGIEGSGQPGCPTRMEGGRRSPPPAGLQRWRQ